MPIPGLALMAHMHLLRMSICAACKPLAQCVHNRQISVPRVFLTAAAGSKHLQIRPAASLLGDLRMLTIWLFLRFANSEH